LLCPEGSRDLLTTGPGPDNGGPKPTPGCAQAPEKSGKDAALGAAPVAGADAWPKAGAATAAVNIATAGKSLRKFMPTSRSSSIAPLDPRTVDVD
jgi:hypothetical protein